MLLKDACLEINKSIRTKINSTKLGNFIDVDDYSNYTLFDFLNIYKIRRMQELGYINDVQEKQLILLYKKYNTKLLELKSYSELHEFTKTIQEEMLRIEDELEFYSIHPNRKTFIINIEDMVDFDIRQNSYMELENVPTYMLNDDSFRKINSSFINKIFNKSTKEIDFAKIYNILKIQLLSEERFTFTNDVKRVEDTYYKYLIDKDEDIYKELSSDPYQLNLDEIHFDIIKYIDWTITRDHKKTNDIPKFLNKEIR